MENRIECQWNGEIRDRALEREYQEGTCEVDFRTIRIAAALTATAYLGGGFSNYFTLGWSLSFSLLLVIRIIVCIAAMTVVFSARPSSRRQHLALKGEGGF